MDGAASGARVDKVVHAAFDGVFKVVGLEEGGVVKVGVGGEHKLKGEALERKGRKVLVEGEESDERE